MEVDKSNQSQVIFLEMIRLILLFYCFISQFVTPSLSFLTIPNGKNKINVFTSRNVETTWGSTFDCNGSPAYKLKRSILCGAVSNNGEEELFLSEENAISVIDDCMKELGTIFGNSQENQDVGITGLIEFVELDGPNMVIRFTGRFWHDKKMVLARVTNYIKNRIPECLDIILENPEQLEEDDQNSVKEFYRG